MMQLDFFKVMVENHHQKMVKNLLVEEEGLQEEEEVHQKMKRYHLILIVRMK